VKLIGARHRSLTVRPKRDRQPGSADVAAFDTLIAASQTTAREAENAPNVAESTISACRGRVDRLA
jgi:hypothetical protein